ncbi:hypothetical protein [Streptomyces winkii]|uniref:hypothetical protein n=1 Tax=Streptomyces winkii TaxID=3051178 RepID=UPI0028D005D2|nr:hypothetical protein [Streptomyces sp. DSM 40971]
MPDEGGEQREFAAGQIDFAPVQHRAVREQVDGQRTGLQRGTRLFPGPQPRADAGREQNQIDFELPAVAPAAPCRPMYLFSPTELKSP